jgi:hypothetical protein
MHVTEYPQVGDLLACESKQCGANPFDTLAGRFVAKELAAVRPREKHARKRFVALRNNLFNIAAKFAKGFMYKIDIGSKARMPAANLAQRAAERTIFMEELWNLGFVVPVPDPRRRPE